MPDDIPKPKGLHEAFAAFFETPSRPALRKLLQENVGECDHLDFKQEWPSGAKLARHILGFANSGGGVAVVGVTEQPDKTLAASGLAAFTDKTDVFNSVKKFLPDGLPADIIDFQFDETEYAAIRGRKFQVLLVDDRPAYLPFVSTANGDGIREGAVYVRGAAATSAATHEQLQRILNRRIATGHSTARALTIRDHLDELQTLYEAINKRSPNPIYNLMAFADVHSVPNPSYPKEGMEAFVAGLIDQKKKVIGDIISNPERE
jgi:schlafen family protein